jgi:predicted nucleic acid-binding protein
MERWYLSLLIDYLPSGPAVLDASVIINLLGSREPVALLQGLGHCSFVEQRTLQEIRKHPVPGIPLTPVLAELIGKRLLEEIRMTDDEYEIYLRYVSPSLGVRLDVGESAALAVAARGACVVIDERKARRIAQSDQPRLIVVSSFRLMVASACRAGWEIGRAKQAVHASIHNSRMAVPKDEAAMLSALLNA